MPYITRKREVIEKMDDLKILERLQEKAIASGNKVTHAQGRFFLKMVDYATSYGVKCEDERGCMFFLSEREMEEKFDVSKGMVTKCLLLFKTIGAIERVRDKTHFKNTIIMREFYEDNLE